MQRSAPPWPGSLSVRSTGPMSAISSICRKREGSMSPSRTKGVPRRLVFALTLSSLLAGCSDIYLDRRETIALGAGDAVAANAAEQTNDPWPRNSFNRHLTFNGQRMQRAVGCYRLDKVTQPVDINPSSDVQAVVA